MVDVSVVIAGLKFKNPVMNAACPISRDGKAMERLAAGGAGGIVTKTISVKPAKVPRPHMGVINRGTIDLIIPKGEEREVRISRVRGAIYGFLNAELWSDLPPEQWLSKEIPYARKVADKYGVPLIASIGYRPNELAELGPKVVKAGAQAIEFSTHYLGHDYRPVIESAKALREAVDVPIFPKLSPHIFGLSELVKELEKVPVDGIVAINTLGPTLHIDIETGKPLMGGPLGHGWLSGPCIKPLGVAIVAEIARHTKLPIIAVGGISRPEDVIEYVMVGASAVQVCTQVIIEGPKVFSRLVEGVTKWLKEHGYTSLDDIRGKALKYLPTEAAWYEAKPPVIDESKCVGCGYCYQVCDYGAIELVNVGSGKRVAKIDTSKCYGCGTCTTICPTRAIKFPHEYWCMQ